MKKLEALIFDVDGTVADTERDGHRVAFNLAFEEHNMDWNWSVETYAKLLAVTGGKERIKFFISDFLENFSPPDDIDAFALTLHKCKTKHYLAMLSKGAIPLRPGVKRLLLEAREKGYRLAISTTTTPENVTYLLTNTLGKESIDWFDVIAAGDIVPAKKPAPDIYIYALEKMGLTADQCIAFEDSQNGVLSSTQAGLKTIVTENGYTQNDPMEQAIIRLDHMGEEDSGFTVLGGATTNKTMLDIELVETLFKA
jgi:HAD superfamily hydrolase (TIGR01509 family)